MRRIAIGRAKPGMELARSIYNASGKVLIGQGVILTPRYIKRLKEKGIHHIYVKDDISEGIEINDLIQDETRIYARSLIKDVMEETARYNKLSRVPAVTKIVNKIVDELLSNDDILVNIKDMRMIDDYTFGHCANVCILSIITGIQLEYDQLRLRDLGVGALLHDIGKMKVPSHILQKPGRLTDEEYELVKQHTIFGFDILRNCDDIRKPAANAAFGHHERYDGSGYPRGLVNEETHEFAKIIAIADVYDAMTSDRVYRKGVEPYQASSYLLSMGNILFEHKLVEAFVKNISLYPIGCSVELSTGEKGLVSHTNSKYPDKPIVRIVLNADGSRCNELREINLAESTDIYILSICEDLE